jgi:hypothetical protein
VENASLEKVCKTVPVFAIDSGKVVSGEVIRGRTESGFLCGNAGILGDGNTPLLMVENQPAHRKNRIVKQRDSPQFPHFHTPSSQRIREETAEGKSWHLMI